MPLYCAYIKILERDLSLAGFGRADDGVLVVHNDLNFFRLQSVLNVSCVGANHVAETRVANDVLAVAQPLAGDVVVVADDAATRFTRLTTNGLHLGLAHRLEDATEVWLKRL